jgi:transitional endoplasmic reticulum ATPase
MDGLESMKDVIVLAATNRPELIDRALLRTGRFDRFVYVPAPDKSSREKIFEIYTRNMPLDEDVAIEKLVEMTEYFVGGDVEALCREAGMRALRENMDAEIVSMKHFKDALKTLHASVTPQILENYEKMDKELRRITVTEMAQRPGTI